MSCDSMLLLVLYPDLDAGSASIRRVRPLQVILRP
jgi:hypothetical protein